MYKSKLQELCQKRSWSLPKYSITKQGLDHNPSFSATVVVNDQSFRTLAFSKSSKEAQNDAARIAFDHFSLPNPNPNSNPNPNPNPNPRPPIPSSSSFPQPSLLSYSGCSGSGETAETVGRHASRQTLQQQQIQETEQTPLAGDNTSSASTQVHGCSSIVQVDNKFKDVQHLYKSELQTYAQKRNLVFPVYTCEREGPPHASRFKCKVTIDGKTYESTKYFPTLKEAEHAAAKVALISLSPDCVQKDDSAFYKNLLQELIQKEGLHLPAYYTNRSGEAHSPVFVSSVEIEGEHFTGEEEKTKKQAELSAAKVAYNAMKERGSSEVPIILTSCQEQDATELLSSYLQSNSSANMQQHVGPDTTMQKDHTGGSSEVPIILTSCQEKDATELLSSYLQSNSFANMQHVGPDAAMQKDHTGEGGSSLSENFYGCTLDAFPSAPCESRSVSCSPSSNCSTNLAVDSSVEPSVPRISLSNKRITIYPSNKPIPDGSTLLPMRDDNWVAFFPPEATS